MICTHKRRGMMSNWVSEHGDRFGFDNQILRTTVGSEVHGISVGGEDHDEMGVYVEPLETILGLSDPKGHYTARTQPDGARSGSGDVDLSLYSLRRYLRLLTVGNPTVLVPIFAAESDVLHCTDLGIRLRADAPKMITRTAGHRFLGYLYGQRERLIGKGRPSSVPNRPELVAKYGFDTKYASHALRLAIQGVEIVSEGRLTLPMKPEDRMLVFDVKTGEYELPDVLEMIDENAFHLESMLDGKRGVLPERPSIDVAKWSTEVHQLYWNSNG